MALLPPNDPQATVAPVSSLPGFDPRQVPVVGVDTQLPAVPPARLGAEALRERFRAPPVWTPDVRREPVADAARRPAAAAVLVGIVQRTVPTVLLTERTTNLSTHSGQVAFPGGRADPGDADAAATALREAWEEVGLEPDRVEVLGTLPVYSTVTSFTVTPVVALVQPGPLRPSPHEVADVFEVPLAFLADPAHHRRHAVEMGGQRREWFSMPWTDPATGKEHFVWGATAGMLRNLYRFLSA